MAAEILLEVRNLETTLEGAKILPDLSFEVNEGEFLTILGPNGSGKSVLLRSLLGLIPHKGTVSWHKKPKIGYLPQGLNQMAVRDMPLTVGDFFRLKRVGHDTVIEYLDLVGLGPSTLKKNAGHLSGGEFQRMLIGWVLVSRPNVLFLDEPTTAIDAAGGETVYSLLRDFWEKQNLTILNVTHDLSIVYANSTHVLCLSRFGHRCYGVPKEILTPDILRDVYGSEMKFYTH